MAEETLLEMAERHASTGREQLARQQQLVERLVRDGQDRMLPEAERALAVMQRLQEEFETSLEYHRAAQGRGHHHPTA